MVSKKAKETKTKKAAELPAGVRPPVREKKVKKIKRTPEQRKQIKQQLKSIPKTKRPIKLSVDSQKDPDENTPSHRFKVITNIKSLEVRVDLPHVPAQYIVCDPEETHFKLNTLGWTKKWNLNVAYPDGITVKPNEAKAEFQKGILTCTIPIDKFTEEAKEKQRKISSAVREGKQMRFIQGRKLELLGMRKKNKTDKPKDDKVKDQPKKSPDNTPLSKEETEGGLKKKKFLTDKEKAMEIVETEAQAEAEKVESKQRKLAAWAQYLMEKKGAKLEQKAKRMNSKQKKLQKLAEKNEAKKQETLSKPPLAAGADNGNIKKKISFGAVTTYKDRDAKNKKKHKGEDSVTEWKRTV